MNTVQSSLYAVALAISLVCLSLVRRTENERGSAQQHRFLIAYLAIEALGFVFEWLMLHPSSPAKSLWLGLLMAESFLVAPCLWLFARAVTGAQTSRMGDLSRLHWVVIVAGALLTLPLIATAHLGNDYADPAHPASESQSLVIHTTMLMCVMLFLCQVPYYLNQTARMLADHTRQSKVLFSSLENASLNSVRLLAFAVSTKWFVGLLRALHCVYLGRDMGLGVAFALLDVGVTVYVVLRLLRQRAFTEDGRTLVARIESETTPQDAHATLEPDKYAKSGLDDPAKARVRRKLEQVMGVGRLYRDNQLTLRVLCDEIRENPHYVSQVINQVFGRNFYDYVNQHRIEHAKSTLILEPDQSVLKIALDSGFNSKSTFNAAFRDHVGCTPTAYRRKHTALGATAAVHLAD